MKPGHNHLFSHDMKHSWVVGGLYDLYALESCFKWFRPRFLWKECGTEWKAVGRLMRVGDPRCHHFSSKRMGLSRPRTIWRKTKSTPMPLIKRQAGGCPRTYRNGRDRNNGIIGDYWQMSIALTAMLSLSLKMQLFEMEAKWEILS